MANIPTVTSKGQITIPKDVRDALGIREHDKIVIYVDGDKAILKPVRKRRSEELQGVLIGRVPYKGREAERDAVAAHVASHVMNGTPSVLKQAAQT